MMPDECKHENHAIFLVSAKLITGLFIEMHFMNNWKSDGIQHIDQIDNVKILTCWPFSLYANF